MSVSSPETRPAPSTPDGAALLADGGPEIALEVKGLVKEYPGTRALDGVDIQIRRGEIHALLGENGAGKTTLIRSICGASRPTDGQIYIEGRPVELHSPQQAQDLGIAVVHQHFNLVPQLSVAENLFLSQTLPRRAGLFVNWSATEKRARKLLDRVGLKIDPWTEVSKLRPDESAMVAIAKAIGSDARIIIMDEPTSALLPAEVSILFGHMRRLATEGHSFLYVSHRLAEVFEIADRVTVLRDGRRAGAWTREEMSRKTIIRAIVGGDKPWIEDTDAGRATHGEPVIVADALAGGRVRDLSFELRSGEILGFAGLPGSGAEEALDLLFARSAVLSGQLTVHGNPVTLRSPRDAKNAGIALVPKNRHTESLLAGASVRENISLPNLNRFVTDPVARFIRRGRERAESQEIATRLAIKMPSIEASIELLERRQSAKGDPRPLAGKRREDLHVELADGGSRHWRQGRYLQSHPPDRSVGCGSNLHFDRGRGISARLPASHRVPRRRCRRRIGRRQRDGGEYHAFGRRWRR